MFTPGDSVMSVAKFWFSSIGAKKLEKYSLRRDERTAAVKKPKKESSARMVYRISSQNASSTFPNICFVSRQTLIGTTGCRSNLSETLRLAPGKHHRGSVLDKSPKWFFWTFQLDMLGGFGHSFRSDENFTILLMVENESYRQTSISERILLVCSPNVTIMICHLPNWYCNRHQSVYKSLSRFITSVRLGRMNNLRNRMNVSIAELRVSEKWLKHSSVLDRGFCSWPHQSSCTRTRIFGHHTRNPVVSTEFTTLGLCRRTGRTAGWGGTQPSTEESSASFSPPRESGFQTSPFMTGLKGCGKMLFFPSSVCSAN